jgi:peptide/nickel transport system permease protein
MNRLRWRERPLFWAALALVAALHALGAAAPLIANDAPLWLSTEQGWRFPALEATAGFERFLLLLAPWILAVPLWAPSRWRLRVALGWPALALVLACAWQLAAPARAFVPAGEWKRQLGAQPALFAPIPFGRSETNPSEPWRPPTWLASAEIDEQGRYVARAGSAGGLELPASPVEVRAGEPARNAALRHPLGTDAQGRDLLARVIWGARNSLAVGLASAALALVIGTLLGALAGWCSGRTDLVVSRAIELVLCFPVLFLVLLVVSVGTGAVPAVWTISCVLGLSGWTGVARLLRAELLRLRQAEFVLAARGLGFSEARVVLCHALPNALSPLIVATSFFAGSAMLAESAVSYLGAGLSEPEASLGGLVRGGTEHAWMIVFPGAVLALAVIAWNLLGEELRELNDPRARERAP